MQDVQLFANSLEACDILDATIRRNASRERCVFIARKAEATDTIARQTVSDDPKKRNKERLSHLSLNVIYRFS